MRKVDELTVAFTLGYLAGFRSDDAIAERGFNDGYETQLDEVFENMVTNAECAIPGVVVVAKRGDTVYHKAFGTADAAGTKPMTVDAQMRFVHKFQKILRNITRLYDTGVMSIGCYLEPKFALVNTVYSV